MDYYTSEHSFLEELLGLREMDSYYNTNQDFNNINGGWTLDDSFTNNHNFAHIPITTNIASFEDFDYSLLLNQASSSYAPFGDELSPPDFNVDSSATNLDSQTFPYCTQEHYYSMSILDDEDCASALFGNGAPNLDVGAPCKVEPLPEMPAFNMGFCPQTEGRKNKVKKLNGQPSKNLMAERRRRKRLNDRLSMLRSVVPKISKMDRTSILGDTIDYMKELLERINALQEEMDLGSSQLSSMSIFKDVKPSELLVRNSPKFDVERRNSDTRIEICCSSKPGLLLSTVTTLEALGLEIQQCVISSFNDFGLQASCSEVRFYSRDKYLNTKILV
ncbi:hypothetical protein CDL12_27440 [Handroanthus impetiginosus]|uniref:BHLH domain-containing protein n=1 Tax=Handroanthus impetiginosus TaxID=429701 RepID=A0A2G9G426_9LAMI|nr:hypothetical protein CDL12_27440 [Handroanthus impetiginosus]